MCILAPRALADIYTLNPGGTLTPTASSFPTGGTPVRTNDALFASATLDGSVETLVYSGDTGNPYGGLTFVYQVFVSTISTDSVSELTVGAYTGFQTDVSYNPSGGVAPTLFSRTGGSDSTLQFDFGSGLLPGQESAFIVVQTSAHNSQIIEGAVQDTVGANVSVLAPVPEPAVGSLVMTGLGAFFLWRRRSK